MASPSVNARGVPRNVRPNARVVEKALTAPTNASNAAAPTSITLAPALPGVPPSRPL
jgi:uncharacterized protein (UPF0147 family)